MNSVERYAFSLLTSSSGLRPLERPAERSSALFVPEGLT